MPETLLHHFAVGYCNSHCRNPYLVHERCLRTRKDVMESRYDGYWTPITIVSGYEDKQDRLKLRAAHVEAHCLLHDLKSTARY